jgi:hypothetical protein
VWLCVAVTEAVWVYTRGSVCGSVCLHVFLHRAVTTVTELCYSETKGSQHARSSVFTSG